MCTILPPRASFSHVIIWIVCTPHNARKVVDNISEAQRKYTNQIILFANYCCHRPQESSFQAFCFENWFCCCIPTMVRFIYRKYFSRAALIKVYHICVQFGILIAFNMRHENWIQMKNIDPERILIQLWFGLFQSVLFLIKSNLMKIKVTLAHSQITAN